MGLHSEILKWLRDSVAPRAFRLGAPIDWRESISIDDVLTRLRRLWNGAHRQEFEGTELFHAWSKFIFEFFAGGGLVHVCSSDVTELVPAMKFAEQKSRDGSSIKYPTTATICDRGIILDAHMTDAVRLDINRACSSRVGVRENLLAYLADCLKGQKDRIPDGRAVIMDYSTKVHPILMTRDYVGPVLLHSNSTADYKQQPEKKPHIKRWHGEADLSLPFWAQVFVHRSRIIVMTIDSDIIVNMANWVCTNEVDLFDSRPALREFQEVWAGATGQGNGPQISALVGAFMGFHRELIWLRPDMRPPEQRHRNFPYEQVDLLELYSKLLYKEIISRFPERKATLGEAGAVNCTLMQLVRMCALNGTDYVDKSDVSHRIGPRDVISSIMRCRCTYFVDMPRLRGDVRTNQGLFPAGDYDPKYCFEQYSSPPVWLSHAGIGQQQVCGDVWLSDAGVAQLLKQHLCGDGYYSSGRLDVDFQAATWLVNFNLMKPSRRFGDPVRRYFMLAARPPETRKQPRDEAEANEEPASKRQRILVHTTCREDPDNMPDPECPRCMALLRL